MKRFKKKKTHFIRIKIIFFRDKNKKNTKLHEQKMYLNLKKKIQTCNWLMHHLPMWDESL